MKNNIVGLPPEYEEMLDKLESQITELFSEIHYYQALVTEKENTIIRLTTENRYLKAQIQDLPQKITPPPPPPQQKSPSSYPSQESFTPPPPRPQHLDPPSYPSRKLYVPPPPRPQHLNVPSSPNREPDAPLMQPQYTEPSLTPSEDTRINKRVCPECGAMGFAIKEVDDRSRVLSYSPQRIYAKKKSCTKCRYEW